MLNRKTPTNRVKPAMPRVTEGGSANKVIAAPANLERMPKVVDNITPVKVVSNTAKASYSPIKKTREVNKVYNTY